MSQYKVLKSVAHNIGHSFTNLMNNAEDDYVMGHILRFARSSGCNTLTIDFATGKGRPPELLSDPISDLPARYSQFFWDLVRRHGSEKSFVKAATLTLQYDTTTQRPPRGRGLAYESPYVCDVHITDDRGKDYHAQFSGWWYPERLEPPGKRSAWWKFWMN